MSKISGTVMRSDARENRERILDIATASLSIDPDVSLSAIAKAAGVGAGTLYRHFANREALILAVYRKEIAALIDLAPTLLADHPPMTAFEHWCARLADYGRIKSSISEVLHGMITARDHEETYWPMVNAVGQLLSACEKSGDFTAGADAEDVLLLLGFLWRTKAGEPGEGQAARLINLVIHGLRKRQA